MASSAGGSELFSSYEQDFTSVTDSIKIKIEQQIPNQKGGKHKYLLYLKKKSAHTLLIEERKATIRAIEREIDEADEIVNELKLV